MHAHPDTYQSFFPKLKPKSTTGKVIIPAVLTDLKSKILNIKTRLSNSQISVVQKTKSSSNFSHLATSSMQNHKTKSNQLLLGSQKKPIYSSKLLKVHSDCFESIKSYGHLRHYSTVDQNINESSKFQLPANKKKIILKKGGLTERKKKKYNFEKKKLKIIDSPQRMLPGSRILEEISYAAEEECGEKGGTIDKGGSIEKRKVILLNKLVECNESLASSISSAIYERIPRYAENLG